MVKDTLMEKIAYFSFVLNMISIFCLSYKAETLIYSNIMFAINAIVMLVAIILRNKSVMLTGLHKYFCVVILWCFASVVWSINAESALIKCWTMVQLFVYSMILLEFFRYRANAVKEILQAYFVGGVVMSIYAIGLYGIDGVSRALFSNYRIGQEINQINTFGVSLAFTSIIGGFLYKLTDKKIYIISILLTIIMMLASGSTTALGIMGLGFGALYWNTLKKNIMSLFLFLAVFVIALNLMLHIGTEINAFQRLEYTLNIFTGTGYENTSSLLRLHMMKIGWDSFLNNPLLGVGLGNFEEVLLIDSGYAGYAHNNFIELLTDLGAIGFSMYYSIYFKLLKKLSNIHSKNKFLFFILLIRLVSEIGAIDYYKKDNYVLLVMFYIAWLQYKENNINDKLKKY